VPWPVKVGALWVKDYTQLVVLAVAVAVAGGVLGSYVSKGRLCKAV